MVTWAAGTFKKWSPPNKGNKPDKDNDSKEDGEEGQDQDGNEPGNEPSDGGNEPGNEPGSGDEPGNKPGGSGESPDSIIDRIQQQLQDRDEEAGVENQDEQDDRQKQQRKPTKQSGKPGTGKLGDFENIEDYINRVVPSMNWKALINLMVSNSKEIIDTSYAKPHRRSVSGLAVADQVGAGAIRPGDKKSEEKHNKICLVLDTSGSMYDNIPAVLAEVRVMLKKVGRSDYPLTAVFFANGEKWFQLNTGRNTYQPISGAADATKKLPRQDDKPNYLAPLSQASTGGTDFSGKLSAGLSMLASQGYNILLFSDSDMIYGSNLKNFESLWSAHKNKVFWICDNLDTWRAACKALGVDKQPPKTFSTLKR